MPQFGRPSTDTNNPGSWLDEAGGSTSIYTHIDEASRDDADYIKTPLAPSSAVYVTKLSTVEDPVGNVNHIIRYAYQKDATGGAQIDLTVQLRQAYVSEASLGTLIHSEVHTNIPNGWTAGTFTLSAGEADTITDYTSLYIRLIGNQV